MSISAKELAKQLGLSAATISIALNDKPGVSEVTRKRVLEAAKAQGFDFGRVRRRSALRGCFAFVIYKKHGAVVSETSFFSELTDGISLACREYGFGLEIHYLLSSKHLSEDLSVLAAQNLDGILVLATEIHAADVNMLAQCPVPIVILDTYFEGVSQNYVLINNLQGAYIAANYLIAKRKCQPGYLRSSYAIGNFAERADGFYKAIRENGMSASKSIVHLLAPSVEGAYADMLSLLRSGESVAPCYFADNDLIAVGAMRAFRACGYRIPEDVGFVGFDNTSLCELIEPPLTTINVPRQAMARVAVERLISLATSGVKECTKTMIMTTLVKRASL